MDLREKVEEAGLLTPEWKSVSTVQLVALATILCGRFLELAYLALASNGCKDKEIWANLSGPRPPRKNDQELAEAIRRSARAAELVHELDENRRRNDQLLRELIVRAALQNRAMVDMLIFAESRSPKIDPAMAMDMVATGLGIRGLDEDAKQIAIAGAVAAFRRESAAALEATLATLPRGLVPPAVTRITPQAEAPATRAKLYRYAYVLVSKLDLIFASDPWLLPNAGWQAFHDEGQRQEAQARGGVGAHKRVKNEPPARAFQEVPWNDRYPDNPHAQYDEIEYQVLNLDLTPAEERTPETEYAEKQRRERRRERIMAALKRRRTGAKGLAFADAILKGKAPSEAARDAGVPERMRFKYQAKLLEIARSLG